MKIRYIFAVGAALLSACGAMAQNTQTGYFVDEYTYSFEMNPAIGNAKNYVAMPGIGNLDIGLKGNLGLKDVLYNVDGRTCLFLNPKVSTEEVMGNISNVSRFNVSAKLQVISFGFKGMGGYNTVAINARAMSNVHVPKAFFSLLKEGVSNGTYNISDMRAQASGFAEVALNHSRDINKEWRVGASLKVLVGAANADATFENAKLTLGTDSWSIESQGTLRANVKGLTYKTDVNDRTGHRYVSGAEVNSPGPNGFGMAFDLGVVYSPKNLKDWQFSAALLDLGFISWKNNMLATTNGVKRFETSKYTFNVDKDADNSFSKEWDRMRDDLSALYELEDKGDTGGRTTGLAATMNLGARYTLPVYRNLTFGLLNTTCINGAYSWTDFRLSANVAPVKVFSAAVSLGAGTYGCSFGWMANLHAPGFNLFLGMDRTVGKLAKQGIPLSSNAQLNFGMNFLF